MALLSHRCPDKTYLPFHICSHLQKPFLYYVDFLDLLKSDCIMSLCLFTNSLCLIPELPSFPSSLFDPSCHFPQFLQKIHVSKSNRQSLDLKIQILSQKKIRYLNPFKIRSLWETFYFSIFWLTAFPCHLPRCF